MRKGPLQKEGRSTQTEKPERVWEKPQDGPLQDRHPALGVIKARKNFQVSNASLLQINNDIALCLRINIAKEN